MRVAPTTGGRPSVRRVGNKSVFIKLNDTLVKTIKGQKQKINILVSYTLLKVMNMEYAIAKVSTKGQIVIPNSLRREIQTGDEFLIVKDEKRIILKNVKDMAKDLKEDLVFAKRVEKAWQDYDKGKFVKKSKDDFLKELRAC